MGLAMGMHFSVVCAEDFPRLPHATDKPGLDFGGDFEKLYERVCADWPRGEMPPDFYAMRPANQPVLLLSGGLDPVTPPRHGVRAAQALGASALHVVVPNAGHGLMSLPCIRELLFRFIDAADDKAALALETGCAKSIPRPPAFLPLLLETQK
jgi:pimeloyl-ACP methyl ester carboxylesterase